MMKGETENEAAAGPEIDVDHQEPMTTVVQKSNLRNKRSGKSVKKKQRHT